MTEDDLYSLPDDGTRHELQAGLLLAEPVPMHPHGRVQVRLFTILSTFVERHGVGEVFGAMGFVLARDPDTVRAPDVSFISRERLDSLGDGTRFTSGVPDLAIEIVSPSNHPGEIHGKVADYLAAGAHLVWVVDPRARIVTVYRTLLAPRRLGEEATLDGGDVIPGFAILVAKVFGN